MSVLFGNNFVALAVGLRDSGPITLQAMAVTVAVPTAFLAVGADRMPLSRMSRQTVAAAALIGMALTVGAPILMVFGVERVSPAVAAMLMATMPISTIIIDGLVFRERTGARRLMGVALGVIGVGFVVAPLGGGEGSELAGVVMLIAASFSWAGGLVMTRRLPGVVGGGGFVAWQMAAGLPVLLVLALLTEGLRVTWTLDYVLAIVYSGAFGKAIGSVLQFRTVRLSTPLHSSMTAFLIPLVAMISSYLLLDETVVPIQILGSAVIAIAVGLVLQTYRPASPKRPPLIGPQGPSGIG
jgi:probable blue pigment (indigoidine) exporter